MSCYVFRVLTTKRGEPRKRKTWVGSTDVFGNPKTTVHFAYIRVFDEEWCGPIVPYAIQWEKDLGCRVCPIEVKEVGPGLPLSPEMQEARAKSEGRVETV